MCLPNLGTAGAPQPDNYAPLIVLTTANTVLYANLGNVPNGMTVLCADALDNISPEEVRQYVNQHMTSVPTDQRSLFGKETLSPYRLMLARRWVTVTGLYIHLHLFQGFFSLCLYLIGMQSCVSTD